MDSNENKTYEIKKQKLKSEYVIQLINGQPVCISSDSKHTVVLPKELKAELAEKGRVVIKLS